MNSKEHNATKVGLGNYTTVKMRKKKKVVQTEKIIRIQHINLAKMTLILVIAYEILCIFPTGIIRI